ncbi:MAG: chromosome segregation protein SMC [Anaerolineae bacterium]|nr:chromosome segregation protein SMC [Anaerolineae bacterium]
MPSRLKSLELQGYKTFASKSLLEFAGNITAIVGPNGSGKSNVADAMRWVLGEQSYSLLRARKTEDMIFSGSERRPRAGMASATVTFDNSDNWLPIDYSEVSITRRAYRDGQNEYLLNGQRVRLKEINELLGRSGLAERTYTVIGQGLVDAALSLRPEERRRFFEEAAGIQLYRRRRDEALGRMDTTRRNMDRALDILSEIKPRLRSLERQAARVEEYERISADLRLLLRDWYGYHWHRSQQEIQHAQEVYRVREESLSNARLKQHQVETRIVSLRSVLQEVRETLNRLHTESSTFHQQREQISRQLAVMDERRRALVQQWGEFESSKNKITEEIEVLEQRLESFIDEREQIRQEVEEAAHHLEQSGKLLKTRLAERAVLDNQIRNLRREVTQMETDQVRLSASKFELENRISGYDETLKVLTAQAKQEEGNVTRAQQALDDISSDLEQAEAQLHASGKAIEEQQELIRTTRATLDAARRERDTLAVEMGKNAAQLNLLQEAERSFSGMNQGSAMLLKSARSGSMRGRYLALNALFDIPAEYEIAAAAVLGEYLDAVVVDEDADLLEALGLLAKKNSSRTILVPKSADSGVDQRSALRLPQCAGLLSGLLTTPSGLENLYHLFFGSAYVMETRQAALENVKLLPPGACAVTLDGEIFRQDGLVIVGREGGKNSMISRTRQIRELTAIVSKLKISITSAEATIKELDETHLAQVNRERDLQGQYRQHQSDRNGVEKAHRQVQLELRQGEERMKFQLAQLDNTTEQITKARLDIEKVGLQMAQLGKNLENQRALVREQQRVLNDLSLIDLQQEENHWKTALAVSNRALQDAEQRVGDYERTRKSTQDRLNILNERMAGQQAELAVLDNQQSEAHIAEQSISQKIEGLNKVITPNEVRLAELEKSYMKAQDDLAAAQAVSASAERNETQAQIDLTRQRDALSALREKIQEDFGLVAFQYESEVHGQETLPFGDMVEQLPRIVELPQGLNDEIRRNRAQLRRLGAINMDAKHEYDEVFERHEFLTQQLDDLKKADENLSEVISELNELMRLEFKKTFDAVASEFKDLFTRLFGGGSARLEMTDEENPTEAGIEIHAKLPGRREQGLALLSGGERSLTAVALVFALLKVSPTPFCILDEVDAMLDESNVGRFCDLLIELSEMGTQFIVITHNRGTVQSSDVIYGVTKGNDSSSQLISLKLDEVSEEMAQ